MYVFVIGAVILWFLLYYLSTRKYDYWKKKNVPYLTPTPLLGNFGDFIFFKKTHGENVKDICEKIPDAPLIGAYYGTDPVLIPKDPELIKMIVTKDFYYFNGREASDYTHRDPFTANVVASHGDRWKVLRQNLTPLFSSAKLKNMFHLIEKCSKSFETLLDQETKISQVVEMRSLTARFTIECIGACAFGVDTETLKTNTNNPFARVGAFISNLPKLVAYKRLIRSVWPGVFYGLGFQLISNELNIFTKLITSVFKERQYAPTQRNDFIDLILGWKEHNALTGDSIQNLKTGDNKKVSLDVDDELLLAQCFVFFTAGFETSSSTLGFTVYELAKDKEAQRKVCEEVDAYLSRHGNKLTYDCLTELPFTEACIDEALRMNPILSVITREVMEDCVLSGIKLEKGVRVHLPVLYLHHNPEYFPDPEVFKPERFLGEAKRSVNPYTYLPFGEGPRTCIGMRFAKMQMLAGMVTLMKKYRLELADGMPQTLMFKPESFITRPTEGIRVKLIEREGWESRNLAS